LRSFANCAQDFASRLPLRSRLLNGSSWRSTAELLPLGVTSLPPRETGEKPLTAEFAKDPRRAQRKTALVLAIVLVLRRRLACSVFGTAGSFLVKASGIVVS